MQKAKCLSEETLIIAEKKKKKREKERRKEKAGLDEAEAGIKFAGRNVNNHRYVDGAILWQKVKRK